MQTKKIVCLANSFKSHGHCLAGKELGSLERWIRPISNRPTHELSNEDVFYPVVNRRAHPLDIMEVRLDSSIPYFYQQENWLIEHGVRPLRFVDVMSWIDLRRIEDKPPHIWMHGDSSTSGVNDRVLEQFARQSIKNSLLLIGLENFQMIVGQPGLRFGDESIKVQGDFAYAGSRYRFQVTDPLAFKYAKDLGMGIHQTGSSFLTISLGEAYKGHCYKLIACVLPQAPLWMH